MHEKISISFKMKIEQDGKEQIIDYKTIGKRYEKNNKKYILYEEPVIEENQSNHITLIISKDEMTIIRKGFVNMNQKFKINQQTIGTYQNQLLKTELNVHTSNYEYTSDYIKLNYQIMIDQNIVGKYDLQIDIGGVS